MCLAIFAHLINQVVNMVHSRMVNLGHSRMVNLGHSQMVNLGHALMVNLDHSQMVNLNHDSVNNGTMRTTMMARTTQHGDNGVPRGMVVQR